MHAQADASDQRVRVSVVPGNDGRQEGMANYNWVRAGVLTKRKATERASSGIGKDAVD